MIILSIDPGYERIGIAVVEKTSQETLLYSDCFQTPKNDDFELRLYAIGEEIERLISEYSPTHLAIEKLFFNSNQKTAMRVAEVRGMILYLAKKYNLSLHQYTPLEIKVAVTGYGKSDKKQIMDMIPHLLTITKPVRFDDEYDAIAVGLTCAACEKEYTAQ